MNGGNKMKKVRLIAMVLLLFLIACTRPEQQECIDNGGHTRTIQGGVLGPLSGEETFPMKQNCCKYVTKLTNNEYQKTEECYALPTFNE